MQLQAFNPGYVHTSRASPQPLGILVRVRLVDAGSNRSLRTARSALRARTARFASSDNTWRDCALRQSTLVCCAQTLRSCALTIDLPSRASCH